MPTRQPLRLGLTALVLAMPLLTGCGAMAGAGSAKASLGVPIDVTGGVTAEGGHGEVVSKRTGEPLFSAAFAIYWPAVLAELVLWLQGAAPEVIDTVLGAKVAKP